PGIGPLVGRDVPGGEELRGGLGRGEHPRADQPAVAVGTDEVGGPQALAPAVLRPQPRGVPGRPLAAPCLPPPPPPAATGPNRPRGSAGAAPRSGSTAPPRAVRARAAAGGR